MTRLGPDLLWSASHPLEAWQHVASKAAADVLHLWIRPCPEDARRFLAEPSRDTAQLAHDALDRTAGGLMPRYAAQWAACTYLRDEADSSFHAYWAARYAASAYVGPSLEEAWCYANSRTTPGMHESERAWIARGVWIQPERMAWERYTDILAAYVSA